MAGIAQNGQKRLIFIVVPQVKTKMREKGKRGKKNQQQQQHKNEYAKGKYTNIYAYVYIHTPTVPILVPMLQCGANSKISFR